MRIAYIEEMAKALSAKTCAKCGQPIVDKNYYYYKGAYNHKGGCPAAGQPAQPAAPQTPSAHQVAQAAIQRASQPAPPSPVATPTAAPAPTPSPVRRQVPSSNFIITTWLEKHGITKYQIDPDTNVVNVEGSVHLDIDDIDQLPVQFGHVQGDFDVGGMDLVTLKGCPQHVGRSFDCSGNLITSFEHGPTSVGRSYVARDLPELTTLKGLPDVIPGTLNLIDSKKFTTLEGVPKKLGSLRLPASAWSGHNVHKMIEFIRNEVYFDGGKPEGSSHWLGFLLIDGLRDGFSTRSAKDAPVQIMNSSMDNLRHSSEPTDPDGPKAAYRDILAVQELMIDAGFSKIARL